MRSTLLSICTLAALAGCATPPAEPVADANRVICTRETPLGTMFAVTKCRTPEQIAAERQAAEEAGRMVRPSGSAQPGGGS